MTIFNPTARVQRLQSAVEDDGYNQDAHFMLGEEYLREGRAMEAAVKFRRVVEMNPDHAEAWRMMGICYEQGGVFKEAASAFNTAAYEFDRQGHIARAAEARQWADRVMENWLPGKSKREIIPNM